MPPPLSTLTAAPSVLPPLGFESRPDGAELLYSPQSPASAQNPVFSPDGRSILFTLFHNGYNEGPSGIYRLALDGSPPAPLLDEADQDAVNLPGSIWDAASGRLAFSSDREDVDEIWTMTAEGGDLFRVTRHSTADLYIEPSFSPDGKWIVFEVEPADGERGRLWKVRADGTELTQLTDGYDDRQPNWSPLGDRILFQRRAPNSDDWNLYTMTPEGRDLRQITTDRAEDTDASWSPDGNWIVYSSDHGSLPTPNLFLTSAGGGQPIRLTFDASRADGAASWSPDGQWIVFESFASDGDESPASLWRISATRTQVHK